MPESLSFSRVRGDKQQFFLGTGKMVGFQDVSVNSNFGIAPLRYIGRGFRENNYIPASEQLAEVSINSLLINNDPFFNLLVAEPVNMFILKEQSDITNNFCLISGYVNSYNASYSIGQIPQVSASFRFYNNAGKIETAELDSHLLTQLQSIQSNNYSYLNTGYLVPDAGSIELTLDEALQNRVTNFNVSIELSKVPIYNVGSKVPKRVQTIYPLDVKCSFSIEMGDYDPTELRSLPRTPQTQDISLSLRDFNTQRVIADYSYLSMQLTNETYSTDIDGNVTVTKEFAGNSVANYLANQDRRITEDGYFLITQDGFSRVTYG